MKSTSIWFVLVCVATLALLEGNTIRALQCYTCENCIEGMDLRELQICGELPVDAVPPSGPVTFNPTTTTATTLVNNGAPTTQRPAVTGDIQTMPTTTTKEISWEVDSELEENYDYSEDDETKRNNGGSDGVVQPMILPEMTAEITTETRTMGEALLTEAVEAKDDSLGANTETESVSEANALQQEAIETDTDNNPEGVAESIAVPYDEEASESEENKMKSDEILDSSISTIGDTATEPIEVDENTSDYEAAAIDSEVYDERRRMSRERTAKTSGFPKAVYPVCYMLQYMVNNTLVTTRGCTTIVADSEDLTCQSLDKGVPMAECKLCTTNGCNKFNEDAVYIAEMTSAADRNILKIPSMFIIIILVALR